jgi:4,4'-diaponeurosporenoate glycosyltransferase
VSLRRSSALRAMVWLAGWAAGWWLFWELPALRRSASESPVAGRRGGAAPSGPSVAVVVPARDEERALPVLLASLAAQERLPTEVVVVDDGSTDESGTVAASFGARVVPAGPRPPGWTGKVWACDVGVRSTAADVLVVLDADVDLAPDALGALIEEHEALGGLLSVLPEHRPKQAYEQLSAPCNVVSVMGTGAAEPGARGRADGAFGPCLVMRRSALQAVGGFAAVRGEVVEDIALAQRFADLGLAVTARRGGDLVGFRMYPDGLAHLAEGWTKNLAAGAAAVPRRRAGLVGLWVTAGLLPAAVVLTGRARRRGALVAALAAWAASTVQFHVLARRVGRFRWWTGPAHPALLAGFTGLVLRSELARRRGVVSWKGRQVAVGRGAPDPGGSVAVDGGTRRPLRALRARSRASARSMRARL